jgi:hypothetical protein
MQSHHHWDNTLIQVVSELPMAQTSLFWREVEFSEQSKVWRLSGKTMLVFMNHDNNLLFSWTATNVLFSYTYDDLTLHCNYRFFIYIKTY